MFFFSYSAVFFRNIVLFPRFLWISDSLEHAAESLVTRVYIHRFVSLYALESLASIFLAGIQVSNNFIRGSPVFCDYLVYTVFCVTDSSAYMLQNHRSLYF